MAALLAAPVMGILLALARFDLVSGGLALSTSPRPAPDAGEGRSE